MILKEVKLLATLFLSTILLQVSLKNFGITTMGPDRNFSIVPKYLAFLRSNSGQEKLEKESLQLL